MASSLFVISERESTIWQIISNLDNSLELIKENSKVYETNRVWDQRHLSDSVDGANCRSAIELSHRDEIIGSLSSLLSPPCLLWVLSHLCAIERGGCRRATLVVQRGYWQNPQLEPYQIKWFLHSGFVQFLAQDVAHFVIFHLIHYEGDAKGGHNCKGNRVWLCKISASPLPLSPSLCFSDNPSVAPYPLPLLDSRNQLGHQDIHPVTSKRKIARTEVLFFAEPQPAGLGSSKVAHGPDRKITRLIENMSVAVVISQSISRREERIREESSSTLIMVCCCLCSRDVTREKKAG